MNKKIVPAVLLVVVVIWGVLYWSSRDDYYIVVPIESLENAYHLPSLKVKIQGHEYELNIDTGTQMALSLDMSALKNIERRKIGISRRLDFRGHQYNTPKYKISGVTIGDLPFDDIEVREESSYFDEEGAVVLPSNIQKLQEGRVGRDFLFQKNVLFDLSRGCLVFCNHLESLKRSRYKPNRFCKVPFEYTKEGIVFNVTTEFGSKKFILDSGATNSLIRSSENIQATCFWRELPAIEFSEFSLSQIHLGRRKLLVLDITPEMEFDGILGVDFLEEYVVFLDFSKHVAYIGSAHDVCDPI